MDKNLHTHQATSHQSSAERPDSILHGEVKVLKNIPLFSNIADSKLKLMAFTSEQKHFEKDDMLFEQGDPSDAAYIIMDGEVEILLHAGSDHEIHLAKMTKNDIVGEIGILCGVPRTASVRALTKVTTMCISKELFFSLMQEFPAMAIEIMKELALKLERANQAYRSLAISQQ